MRAESKKNQEEKKLRGAKEARRTQEERDSFEKDLTRLREAGSPPGDVRKVFSVRESFWAFAPGLRPRRKRERSLNRSLFSERIRDFGPSSLTFGPISGGRALVAQLGWLR